MSISKTVQRTFLETFVVTICFFLLSHAQSFASKSNANTASICEKAALAASRESGVPLDVLRAISLTETGRNGPNGFLPWPWTVNMEGTGKWFDALSDAKAYVDKHFARGARSFDVGCFQINYRWHGQAFASIDEMFEPLANARYAAKFLSELYDEFGDWSTAAGAFHSRTPKYARKYKSRFDRIRSRLPEMQDPIVAVTVPVDEEELETLEPVAAIQRVNRYPLLQAGNTGSYGSLVPLVSSPAARFLDVNRSTSMLGTR